MSAMWGRSRPGRVGRAAELRVGAGVACTWARGRVGAWAAGAWAWRVGALHVRGRVAGCCVGVGVWNHTRHTHTRRRRAGQVQVPTGEFRNHMRVYICMSYLSHT